MAGGRHADELRSEPRSGTPRGELTRFDESRERRAEETRDRILGAMLETCGEKGYRRVAVQDVIDRYEGNRVQFYRHFTSKADCYAAAHEAEVERLRERVAAVALAESGWRLQLRAGLDELARFAEESPLLARGLLVEVHVAAGPALAKRAEIHEQAVKAIDGGRGEDTRVDGAPPPITAQFMAGAVESTLTGALAAGEPQAFAAAVPELTHMIVATYLGEEAAREELAAASAA
jgi:AcrR family transcriptional regulator